MPKAKKSGLTLSSDFKKQKTKLGRGKQQANNATDTSFKSRSIALPQQSVSRDKAAAPVTRRNLTLDELIGQTRHYSASVRRDALQGLEEISIAHPALKARHIGVLITAAARLIADEDAAVRKAVQNFLAYLLERTSNSQVRPYMDTLLLYTTSAMSHIFPDIRLDAVRVADLCLTHLGHVVTLGWEVKLSGQQGAMATSEDASGEGSRSQGHGARMLDCYLNLLGASLPASSKAIHGAVARASVTSTDLSLGARLVILRSLALFMRLSTTPAAAREEDMRLCCPTWFFESSFASSIDYKSFAGLFSVHSFKPQDDLLSANALGDDFADVASGIGAAWTASDEAHGFASATRQLDDGMQIGAGDEQSSPSRCRLFLFEAIESLLMASLLDCVPSAFPPEGSAHGIQTAAGQLVCVVAELVLTLWRGIEAPTKQQEGALAKLLARMALYLPHDGDVAAAETVGRASEAAKAMMMLNLSYCELVGLLRVVGSDNKGQLSAQLAAVSDYIIAMLAPPKGSRSLLRENLYVNILPTVWLLLSETSRDKDNTKELSKKGSQEHEHKRRQKYEAKQMRADKEKGKQRDRLLVALFEHWEALSVAEDTKWLAAEFLGRLILLPTYTSYAGSFRLGQELDSRALAVQWLTTSLPRYLWELGSRSPAASDLVLEMLRIVTCAGEKHILQDEDIKSLQRPFATFFQVKHPKRGAIDGPYARMPPTTRRRAESVLTYLASLEDGLATSANAMGAI